MTKTKDEAIGFVLDLIPKDLIERLLNQAIGLISEIDDRVGGTVDYWNSATDAGEKDAPRVVDQYDDEDKWSAVVDDPAATRNAETQRAYTNAFYIRCKTLINDIRFENQVLISIQQPTNWCLKLEYDKKYGNRIYIQVGHYRRSNTTNTFGWQYSRKVYLSPHMTDREIVGYVYGLFTDYTLQEVSKGFTYKGKRIFGPDIALDALLEVADRVDVR